MKTKGMISRIFCIIFSALVYVGIAFNFVGLLTSSSLANTSEVTGISFSDWWKGVSEATADSFTWWKIAQVLYVIMFITAGILIIGTVIQFFVKNKYLNLIVKIAGIVTLVLAIVSVVFNIMGEIALTSDLPSSNLLSMSYIPHIGTVVIAIAGIVAGSVGIACGKKIKN